MNEQFNQIDGTVSDRKLPDDNRLLQPTVEATFRPQMDYPKRFGRQMLAIIGVVMHKIFGPEK
jgi:hypothetical protein